MTEPINLAACISATERQLRRHYENDVMGRFENAEPVLELYYALRKAFEKESGRRWKSDLKDLGVD